MLHLLRAISTSAIASADFRKLGITQISARNAMGAMILSAFPKRPMQVRKT